MFRDRYRRSPPPPPRMPRNSHSNSPLPSRGGGGGKNAPSRHLWVGNLAHEVTKPMLVDVLIRYGELESVSLPPGRSYAFVNYVDENDAIVALDSLQGFDLAGFPLRIEFAKADKASAPPRDENYSRHRDEVQPSSRSYNSAKRDLRTRHASPEPYYPDPATRTENSDEQPSDVLWIGFPSFLKVDETILRKAFSPFGEIVRITAFAGRPYAFVQFSNLGSACRAKETLQGRLFGNPRVSICFAKSDNPSTGGGRRGGAVGSNAPPSPRFNMRAGSSDRFSSDFRTPQFSELEYRDPDIVGPSRNDPSRLRGNGAYDERSPRDFEPHVGELQGFHRSHEYPRRDRDGNDPFNKFSPETFPRRRPLNDDPWDSPRDSNIYHGTKKLKTDPFPEEELPEYPLHTLESGKPPFPAMFPDLPIFGETGTVPYNRPSEHPMTVNRPIDDKHDWRSSSHEGFVSPPPPSASAPEWKRMTPELPQPAPKQDLWKWEGTIAKGGTPVCRARCFPVGRVMDIILPEFLDCTARTGLEMLAKHYYQAAGSWVVFFVPASDADMVYYNEFLHYLGDKQRAAVSKIDERHTLFLVPPSDFSEKVLKVPGKLSISGVVLRLEPASPTAAPLPPPNETTDRPVRNPYVDMLHSSLSSYQNLAKTGATGSSYEGNTSSPVPSSFPGYVQPNQNADQNFPDPMENRHGFQQERPNPVSDGTPYSGRYTGQNPSSHLGQDGHQFFGSSSVSSATEEYRPLHAGMGPPGVPNVVGNQATQEIQGSTAGGGQDEGDNDPQKRLQATLQLAAALLQQIQQGKK